MKPFISFRMLVPLVFLVFSHRAGAASRGDDPGGPSSPAGPSTMADVAAQAFENTSYAVIPLEEPPAGMKYTYFVNCVADGGLVDFSRYSESEQIHRRLWRQGQIDSTIFPDYNYRHINRAGYFTDSEKLSNTDGSSAGVKGSLGNVNESAKHVIDFSNTAMESEIYDQRLEWEEAILDDGWASVSISPFTPYRVNDFSFLPLEDGTAFCEILGYREFTRTRTRLDGSTDDDSNPSVGSRIYRWGHWDVWDVNGSAPSLFDGASTIVERLGNYDQSGIKPRLASIMGIGGMGDDAFFLMYESNYVEDGDWTNRLTVRNKSGGEVADLRAQGFVADGGGMATSRNGHIAKRGKTGTILYQRKQSTEKKDTLSRAFGTSAGGIELQVNDVGDLLFQNANLTGNVVADMLVRKFTDPATGKIVWAKRQFSNDTLPEGWSGLQISALANAQTLVQQRELEAQTPPAYPPKPEDTPAPMLGGTAMKNEKQYPVLLLQVEIEQQNYTAEKGIRFCRWLDSFTGNTLNSDCAEKDRDRFRIRIPAVLPNLTKIHIKSSGLATAVIDGQWVSKITDGDYDVTMKEENGAMVSTWMLLVSDGDDDKYYNGTDNGSPRTDNGPNDQTLLANFNSSIEVTLPEYQNAKTVFFAQKPLGDVEIQPYYLSPAGDVPPAMADLITNHLEKMKEIYRQIGVRAGYYGIVGKAVPQSWFNPGSNEAANYFTPSESNLARAAVRGMAVPGKQIRIGFVDATVMQYSDDPFHPEPQRLRGFTLPGTDGIIVSIELNDARTILGVTAHEVGHALGLYHTSVPSSERWLMRGAPGEVMIWNNKPPDSKRFDSGDFDIIRNSQSFYVPN